MFRHLLVPLDGSRLAETVLPAAAELAGRVGAQLTLLHVIESEAPARVHGERHLTVREEAAAYLEDVRRWLAQRGLAADTRVEESRGDVAERIGREAAAIAADLVALCTHGGRGVRGLLSHGQVPLPVDPRRCLRLDHV